MSLYEDLELGTKIVDLVKLMISQVERAGENETAIKYVVVDVAGCLTSITVDGIGFLATAAVAYFEPIPWIKTTVLTGGISGTILISDGSSELVKSELEEYWGLSGTATGPRKDPIILDLNGDGIKTTTITNGVHFDYANDGFAESTAWADSSDGMLVTDTNSNGAIDNQNELVTSLALYDSNGDGVINSSDTNFSKLEILKGDGTLESLAQAGIASISLNTTNTNTTDANGNTQVWSGSYTKKDGTILTIGDYELQTNIAYSVATNWVDVSDPIAALPDISGYGTIYSLHQAMARDTSGTLQSLVNTFISETADTNRWSDVDSILNAWTGASSVSSTSRGSYVNAQHLAVVEAFIGEEFVSSYDGSTNPNLEASDFIEQAYISVKNLVYAELMSQSTLSDLFSAITINYDSTTGTLTYDLSNVITTLQADIATDATTGKQLVVEFATALKGLGLDSSSNYYSLTNSSDFYNTFTANDRELKFELDSIGKSYDTSYLTGTGSSKDDIMYTNSPTGTYFHSLEGDDVVYGGSGNDEIWSCSGDDIVDGGAGNDAIYGCNGNDTLYGGAGADNVQGGAGNDIIYGGTGNDVLNGGADNDTYVFNIGDGNDTITDESGTDKIVFGASITLNDLTITTSGNNKVITLDNYKMRLKVA